MCECIQITGSLMQNFSHSIFDCMFFFACVYFILNAVCFLYSVETRLCSTEIRSLVLAVSLSFTGDVSIPVTLPPPSFFDLTLRSFVLFSDVEQGCVVVLCDVLHSIYCVCSWTLHKKLCDLCLK